MNDQTPTVGALLIGAIEAEFTAVRYSPEAKAALEQQLMAFGSVIQQNLADIVKRLRDEYTGTRVPPSSLVLRSVKWVQAKSTSKQSTSSPSGKRPATPQEVGLLMRAYHAHGVEYTGKLALWMEAGNHDYSELEEKLPPRSDIKKNDLANSLANLSPK